MVTLSMIPEKIALDGMKNAYSAIRHTQFLVKGIDHRANQIESLTEMADNYFEYIQENCRFLARWKARRLMRLIENAREEENLSVPALESHRKPLTVAIGKIVSG